MADAKKPPAPATNKPQAPAQISPEAEANARIDAIQETCKTIEGELRTLSGRFKNRDPALIKPLQAENAQISARLALLEKAFLGLLVETTKPRQVEEMKTQLDILKSSAVEYFRKANINPDLWKNIAF